MQKIESMDILVDGPTPRNVPLTGKYKRSFAYLTLSERCPVIITRVIDSLSREKNAITKEYGPLAMDEVKCVIGELSQLKNHLITNKLITCFKYPDPDLDVWNSHIMQRQQQCGDLTYYEADWLFAECYLYRKIREIFAVQRNICNLDPYQFQKRTVLKNIHSCLRQVLENYETEGLFDPSHVNCLEELKDHLRNLFQNSLWANRDDLARSAGDTNYKCTIVESLEKWSCNILVNELGDVLDNIFEPSHSEHIVDYVLDNGGYELFSDLCLADYLVMKCGIRQVRFRAKRIPWYVSDVTVADFHHTINHLVCDKSAAVQKFASRWQSYVKSGAWTVQGDIFWCTAFTYSEMPEVDICLYQELQNADLIIFKGDLNYRKLVQDMNWEPTVKFSVSLGKFHPAPLVALRTCKADTIAGLAIGVAEKTSKKSDEWMVSGEFAVIQFDKSCKSA